MATFVIDPEVDLLGLAEIASRFNVPYSTALSWTRTRDFPPPLVTLKMGPIWHRMDVVNYRARKESK